MKSSNHRSKRGQIVRIFKYSPVVTSYYSYSLVASYVRFMCKITHIQSLCNIKLKCFKNYRATEPSWLQ